jgi:hypothetical protein
MRRRPGPRADGYPKNLWLRMRIGSVKRPLELIFALPTRWNLPLLATAGDRDRDLAASGALADLAAHLVRRTTEQPRFHRSARPRIRTEIPFITSEVLDRLS